MDSLFFNPCPPSNDNQIASSRQFDTNIIETDEANTLSGIPAEAWDYKLGNRSALEWVLDQYKEKKPSDPTIAEKFNSYRFADYKEEVIALLGKVCRVSVETVGVVRGMGMSKS